MKEYAMMKRIIYLFFVSLFVIGCQKDAPTKPEPNRNSRPNKPSDLNIVFNHDTTEATLTWQDNSDNENGFNCYLRLSYSSSALGQTIDTIFSVPENTRSSAGWATLTFPSLREGESHWLLSGYARVESFNFSDQKSEVDSTFRYPNGGGG